MKPRRLAVQLFSFILIVSLVAGCGKGSTPATAPATGTPGADQDATNAFVQDLQSVTPEIANQAELDMLNLERDQSGARAAFGDQADAIFLQIDQDRVAALEEMVSRATGAVTPPLKVSAWLERPGTSGPTVTSALDEPRYMTESMVQAFISLLLISEMSNSHNENAIGDITEGGDPVGAPGTHYSFQPLLLGSRLEATGTITTIVATPYPYQETITYDLSMEVCPDPQGNVPIHLSLHSSASLLGGGVQLGADSLVTGHVNDEGMLDSTDFNTTYQGSRQPIHGVGENLGTVNTFFERQENATIYENSRLPATGTDSNTRQSSEIDQQFNNDVLREMRMISLTVTLKALDVANKKWTTGYCVEIQVPELGSGTKTVEPNSSTQFTARVHHKFEESELPLPVIATLANGQVSVTPSGSKVPAPADFTYKAPDQDGQTATVHLETRSKRGIATLDVKFITASWTGEGTYRKAGQQSGMEVIFAYTFSITFHALADGTIEGTGELKKTEASNGGQGMICKDLGTTAALIFPPLEVTGTVKPDGTFQLTIKNQPSINTWTWECTMKVQGITAGTVTLDEGVDLGPTILEFEIPAADGAQANGTQDLGGYAGSTGSADWTLQIHQQAAP